MVLKYVRAAAITAAASSARAAALSMSLQSLTGAASAAGLRGAQCTEELVADFVERALPGALARSRATLVAELKAELVDTPQAGAAAESSASSSSSSSSVPPPGPAQPPPQELPLPSTALADIPREVSNARHRRRHLIRVGPPILNTGSWTTACGWRFGRSQSATTVDLSHRACDACARNVRSNLSSPIRGF